jgi:hypothetical protein
VFYKAEHPSVTRETLATLGDSLALCCESTSGSRFVGRTFDVGAFEKTEIALIEVDAHGGRQRRRVLFAPSRLGDALVRLYERYAELLPDGPERDRAAATARSVAALLGPAADRDARLWEPSRSLFAPDVEATDHRTVGFGSLRGVDAVVRALRALRQLSDDFDDRFDDVLDLRSDTLLLRWTTSGTIRASGGAFAQDLCMLWVFGADGLAKRWEQFDAVQEAAALARFDELTAEPEAVRFAAAPSRVARKRDRRVRPNAATANAARVDAAIAAKDVDAFATLWADESEAVAHETGTRWDRQGSLAAWRSMMKTRDPSSRHEPLATLGDSLALCCWSTSASGFAGRTFDVGAYEREEITLVEVDAQGRRRRTEAFAVARLGDGVARLYERYAELLPDGPERIRAAGAARSIAGFAGQFDVERFATTLAPAVEVVDHRILGSWSGHGADAMLRGARALVEVADDVTLRDDDVLGLRPGACLVRRTHLGTDRAGGGPYERLYLMLCAFGPDGRFSRLEWFDIDRDAEALARFDELTAEPAPLA